MFYSFPPLEKVNNSIVICALLTKHEVKMAGYWQSSFFFAFLFLWTETNLRSIKTQKKQGQYEAILTEQAWLIKDFLYGQNKFPGPMWDAACPLG